MSNIQRTEVNSVCLIFLFFMDTPSNIEQTRSDNFSFTEKALTFSTFCSESHSDYVIEDLSSLF